MEQAHRIWLTATVGALGLIVPSLLALPACSGTVVIAAGAVGGGSGAGGGGGAHPQAACNALEADPVRTLPGVVVTGDAIQLATTSGDGWQLSLLYSDTVGPFSMVTFSPWTDWPSSPLGTPLVVFDGRGRFAVPPHPEDGYGLALDGSYLHRASASDDYPLFNPVDGGYPMLITGIDDNGDRLRVIEGDYLLSLHVGDQLMTDVVDEFACASEELIDAIQVGDGFLLAIGSATDVLTECPDDNQTPIRKIVLMRYRRGAPPELIEVVDVQGSVGMLRLVPKAQGTWLLWDQDSTLMAKELGDDLRASSETHFDPERLRGATKQIARRGDGFVMSSAGRETSEVEVFGPDARLVASIEYPTSYWLRDQPVVAVAPDGSSIVTAWVDVPQQDGDGAGPLVFQRFRCVP